MSAHPPMNAAVWFEIPVTDMDKAKAFYGAVVQGELIEQNDGPNSNPMATFPVNDMKTGVSGSIYPGNPPTSGSGNTVHLAAPGRLEDTMKRVADAGGQCRVARDQTAGRPICLLSRPGWQFHRRVRGRLRGLTGRCAAPTACFKLSSTCEAAGWSRRGNSRSGLKSTNAQSIATSRICNRRGCRSMAKLASDTFCAGVSIFRR